MQYLKNKVKRRDFIRTIARAGLTLPFTGQFLMSSKVFAQTGGPKRFVMVFYPNGCVRDSWHAYNTGVLGSGSFNSSPLEHLAKHSQYLLPIKNLTYAGHGGNEGHPEACRGVFSGGQEFNTTFDATLGTQLPGRLLNNLYVGCWSSRANSNDHMPFTSASREKVKVPDDPQQVYDSNIADVVRTSVNTEQRPEDVRRRRVLEALSDNLDVLQQYPLNVRQQEKLLSHEEALAFYKNVLETTIDVGDGTGFSRPGVGMSGINEEAEEVAKAQMRNIAMAFQANITNVASFQFMGAQDEQLKINFPSIRPYMGDFAVEPMLNYDQTRSHVSSHNESSLFNAQTRWYNIMVSYLLDELLQRNDPVHGGKLIDHTVVLVMSEMGGGSHQTSNPGVYLAGGGGGRLNTGVAIDAGGAGMSNLFLDIANAFGLGWSRYGNSFGGVNGVLR